MIYFTKKSFKKLEMVNEYEYFYKILFAVLYIHCTHLFVGKYKQHGISELILGQHPHQLFATLADTLAIVAVDDENKT